MKTWHTTTPSTLGDLTLVRDATGIVGLYFPHHWHRPDPATFGPVSDTGFDEVISQLKEHLAGKRRGFELPLSAYGDDFQTRVWQQVREIPYGHTVTYGALAAQVGGRVSAQRIGNAVARNPLCILVPCHRVVGSGGKLTGYAGGIARKQQLLALEHTQLTSAAPSALQLDLVGSRG